MEHEIVCRAQQLGLSGATPSPAYFDPNLCTAISLALAVPTFGYSLIFVPILWIAQHDQTMRRLSDLRRQLETIPSTDGLAFDTDMHSLSHGCRSTWSVACRSTHKQG
jgi:hypothetical protein